MKSQFSDIFTTKGKPKMQKATIWADRKLLNEFFVLFEQIGN